MLGPHLCVSHGVWLDGDDQQRLADRGASLSHNPGSNLKLGSGVADLRRMLDRKINVAIGTDGTASSDNLNVFEAMRLASYLSRVQDHPTERWVSAREAFRAATEGGARALGFEKIGRIEAGYKADLVFIDAGALHYVPLNDFIQQLVFAEDGTGVDSVMIGGRMVLWHRTLTTVDVARIRRQAEEAVARLAAANAEAKVACDTLAPYVGQFCSGLAATRLPVHRFFPRRASAPCVSAASSSAVRSCRPGSSAWRDRPACSPRWRSSGGTRRRSGTCGSRRRGRRGRGPWGAPFRA
jgi:guanine deaminase